MALTEREKELLSSLARDEELLEKMALEVYEELVDDAVISLAFEIHRSIKTGLYFLIDPEDGEIGGDPDVPGGALAVDVFGQLITTTSGVPALKKQCECVCPNCQRNLAASRFAPHLEKCMGMGRNSSRIASRRLANSSKDSATGGSGYREDDGGDDEDEDWIEPSKSSSSNRRKQRDKNSPRRIKGSKNHGGNEYDSHSGVQTPPLGYESMTLEERSNMLSNICGVISSTSRKMCMRSTKCPVHSSAQRRDVRLRWLTSEEDQVDIDSFTEGDTTALRESLAQLSNASSPVESTISTSSNPSAASSLRGTSGRREKGSRSKKGKSGSKGGSRGSTPPLPMME